MGVADDDSPVIEVIASTSPPRSPSIALSDEATAAEAKAKANEAALKLKAEAEAADQKRLSDEASEIPPAATKVAESPSADAIPVEEVILGVQEPSVDLSSSASPEVVDVKTVESSSVIALEPSVPSVDTTAPDSGVSNFQSVSSKAVQASRPAPPPRPSVLPKTTVKPQSETVLAADKARPVLPPTRRASTSTTSASVCASAPAAASSADQTLSMASEKTSSASHQPPPRPPRRGSVAAIQDILEAVEADLPEEANPAKASAEIVSLNNDAELSKPLALKEGTKVPIRRATVASPSGASTSIVSGEWKELLSEKYQRKFWVHTVTKEKTWINPMKK